MSFHNKAIIVTGAASPSGQIIAKQLGKLGTKLALIDRNAETLTLLCQEIGQQNGNAHAIVNDFQEEHSIADALDAAVSAIGNPHLLINVVNDLTLANFQSLSPTQIAQKMYNESIIPMMISHAIMPSFVQLKAGHIVNVGNIYGALGLAGAACKSATTQALASFSQALHREYKDQGITVSFIAARPIKTAMTDPQASQNMLDKQFNIEEPIKFANQVIDTIHAGKSTHYIGQPESFLAWVNQLSPTIGQYLLNKYYTA